MTREDRKYVKQAFDHVDDIVRLSNVEDVWEVSNGIRALVTVHVKTPFAIQFESYGEIWTEPVKMGKHKILVFIREPYVPHPVEGQIYPSLIDVEAIYS
jgi:hypothetical protein